MQLFNRIVFSVKNTQYTTSCNNLQINRIIYPAKKKNILWYDLHNFLYYFLGITMFAGIPKYQYRGTLENYNIYIYI